jgi:NAD(P)-dependent dehydrogenase (short-subunit alcohol dehydrogenase family)
VGVSGSPFTGRTAIVTGAGSGIGAALSRALTAAGADVVHADLDGEAAARVAGTGHAAQVDVTDAPAVQRLVDETVARTGRLDLMFNNAGIGAGGDAEDIPLEDWDRVIDVNIRGVVHGVAAAYPVMVRQRGGHLVNTASLAGLAPAGLLVPYAMSKHAVVGLSTSLRVEAAVHGVRVSAVCPGVVETPLLDTPDPRGRFDARRYLTTDQGVKRPMPAADLAAEVLDGVARNRACIVAPAQARLAWRLARLSPGLVSRIGGRAVARQRAWAGSKAAHPVA